MPSALIRYLLILKEIPAFPGHVAAGTLARQLREMGVRVSVRTVQRDLKRLSRHFPIRRTSSCRPLRWYWAGEPRLARTEPRSFSSCQPGAPGPDAIRPVSENSTSHISDGSSIPAARGASPAGGGQSCVDS